MVREASAMGRPETACAAAEAGQLEELEFHWGDAYEVAVADGMWTGRRRDGKGGALADTGPEGRARVTGQVARVARFRVSVNTATGAASGPYRESLGRNRRSW